MPRTPDSRLTLLPKLPRPVTTWKGDPEMTARYDAACERLGDLVAAIAGERSEVAELLAEIRAIEAERRRRFDAFCATGVLG